VTIKVFPSKFSATPAEVHQFDGPTVGDWLDTLPSYCRYVTQQFSVAINGKVLPQESWHQHQVSTLDSIAITVEPKGTELFFGGLFLVATRMMTPKIPKMNSAISATGKDLDQVSVKGNKIKLNDVRPQIAGRRKVYMNVLKPPHRYFHGKRDQRVNLCLDVGVGSFDIQPSDIYIGDTPILSMGDNASFRIYQPGASLAADDRAVWWHDVAEVGAGSNGSSGLEMTLSTDLTLGYIAYSHQFNGTVVSIPVGSGNFPADWTAGLIVRVVAPYNYDVINDAAADIIRGPAVAMLAPVVGDPIEIAGVNGGYYNVRSFSPYQPPVPGTPGTASVVKGSAPPTRFDFDVTPLTFTLRINSIDYPITLNTATTNLAGLVAAVNAAKPVGAPFSAAASSGVLRIAETGTPSGGTFSVTGGADILGSTPIIAAGAAPTAGTPEQQPEITLSTPDGNPVRSLATGSVPMAIGPVGLRFRLVTASTTNLTVDRLTSSGAPDPSFPGFLPMETTGAVITLDPSNLVGGYRGPFAVCPEGELATEIKWDTFHPQGLCGVGREGQIYEVNAYHSLEYRDMATAGAWTVVDVQHRNGKLDSCGFTDTLVLPYPMRAEARIIKRFVSQPGRTDDEKKDETVWYGLRSRLSGATSYPGSTTMTLMVRGGDRLSAQAESQVWVRATRKLPVRRGGVWQPAEATRDIVPFCLYLLKSVGYKDADLDLSEWDRLDEFWRARGDTYDQVHNSASTVQQILQDALAVGFAELTVVNGLLRPVRDEPQLFYKALYTVDAQEGEGLDIRFDSVRVDDYDGVEVKYTDGVKWQVATVRCLLPGDAGKRMLTITADGITNRDKAYQFGMRRRGEIQYRRKTFTWDTEMAGLNSNYLDYVQVAGDTPGYSQSTIMEAYNPATRVLTATEPFNWDEFVPPYFMSVRKEDGQCFGPLQVTKVDDFNAQLSLPLNFTPLLDDPAMQRPLVLLGVGYSVQITDIKPRGTDDCGVEARIYSADVYTYDDSPAPPSA